MNERKTFHNTKEVFAVRQAAEPPAAGARKPDRKLKHISLEHAEDGAGQRFYFIYGILALSTRRWNGGTILMDVFGANIIDCATSFVAEFRYEYFIDLVASTTCLFFTFSLSLEKNSVA